MKKLLAVVLLLGLMFCSSAVAESPDLQSMSFDELAALKESIEQEMKTRNVKKLDFHSLTIDELQELIVQSLLEMCSREEWVNELSPASSSKMLKSLFGRGISLIFRDTKETYYYLWVGQDDIELEFPNALEQIVEHSAGIKIGN